jgi:2'-5' RNA ligase
VRAFIAIHPSAEIVERLAALRIQLEPDLPSTAVRWSDQLHLTTQFLGNIDDARVNDYAKAIRNACASTKSFTLSSSGIGCFPGPRHARVIWAGLNGDVETLQALKTVLDNSLATLGYVPETRPFKPHLTIARVRQFTAKQRQRMPQLIQQYRDIQFGEWRVDRIDFMQSLLSPKGAQYKLVECVEL